jgi:hypothetical protein
VKESSSGIPADLAEMIRARLAARKSAAQQTAMGAPPTSIPAPPPAVPPAEPVLVSQPSSAAVVSAPERDWRWIIIAGVVIVAVIVFAIYWYYR